MTNVRRLAATAETYALLRLGLPLGLTASVIWGGCQGERVKVEGVCSPAEHSTERAFVSGFGAPEKSDGFFIGSLLPNYPLDDRGVLRLSFDSFPLLNNGALIVPLSFDWEKGDTEERCAPGVMPIVSPFCVEGVAG